MNRLRNWLSARSEREQQVVFAGVFVGLPLILWLALWQPLLQARDSSAQRLEQRRDAYLWMQEAAAQIRVARGNGRQLTVAAGSTQQQITSAARQFSLAISRIEPQAAGRYSVQVSSADYNSAVRFVDALLMTGMPLHSLAMGRLDVPGKVSLRVSLGGTP